MRPPIWQPPMELSLKEEAVVKRIRKARLFVFLRQIRHELFDSDFQLELATIFKDIKDKWLMNCTKSITSCKDSRKLRSKAILDFRF